MDGAGTIEHYMQKKNLNPYRSPYAEINWKQIIDVNVRSKTIVLENIETNLCDLGFGNYFLI